MLNVKCRSSELSDSETKAAVDLLRLQKTVDLMKGGGGNSTRRKSSAQFFWDDVKTGDSESNESDQS